MTFESLNPATGEVVARYPATAPIEVDAAITACQRAFRDWRESPLERRGELLGATAEVLRDERQRLAGLMTSEMGKTLREARAEIDKCAWLCEHVAGTAARDLAPIPVATDAVKSFVSFQPLGVVLGVMPWNFPFWQAIRFAVPALAAGNGALLKHASNVPGCALAVEEVFRRAGFPPDIFRTLLISSGAVAAVIDRPEVKAVSLTGSTPAGRAVASRAGARLKKTLLELGGSDPYVILDDADLEEAAEVCAFSRLLNAGQSCVAAKRFVVTAANRGRFEELLVARMAARRVGDPTREDTDLGPLARLDLRQELHQQVEASIERGARLLLGGEIPTGTGAFYPPTVLTDVAAGMPAYGEELFGPVAAILPTADEEEALQVANDSPFGLGAAVFSRDVERAESIATTVLEVGNCFVNTFVRSDPRLPFGGVKESGYGRELGVFGIREFVNVKTVYVG